MKPANLIKFFLFSFLLVWLGLFLAQKINLTTADLGRHLKNGEIFLSNPSFKNEILSKNFYSFTHPDFPFQNHHWGSGIIFFIIFKLFNFKGLSIFFIFLSLLTFSIFFWIAQKKSNFSIAFLVSILLIPLVAARAEIRPEIFSYLFSGIFLALLFLFQEEKISPKVLLISLFIIEIFWVNLHIYFIFGLIILAAFLLEEIIKWQSKKRIQILLISLFLLLIAFLFNPQGWRIFNLIFIFKNYGYLLVENQSIRFLEKLNFIDPNFLLFKIIAFLLLVSSILILIKRRRNSSFSFHLPAILLAGMAFLAIRNFTLFALFALPTLSLNAYILKDWLKEELFFSSEMKWIFFSIGATIIFFFNFFSQYNNFPPSKGNFGLGLLPEVNKSIEFFKENGLSGPIFNNYDIGNFLIFHLFPEEKVFVDNRPEAYPASFFKEEYIPMQEKEEIWQKLNDFYKFNVIFFYRHDATPWAQPFLIKRLEDPNWTPVFVDDFTIIFLKNNQKNQAVIEKYRIPKEYFQIIKTKP